MTEPDPRIGAPAADWPGWPVLHRPSARWTWSWRAGMGVVGAGAALLVWRAGTSGGLSWPGWVVAAVGVCSVAWGVARVWARAARPRLRRSDAHALDPRWGSLLREKRHEEMRRAVRSGGPLSPELRRPAAVALALDDLPRVWFLSLFALAGLLLLVLLATSPARFAIDPVKTGAYALLYGALWRSQRRERRISRAIAASGVAPLVAGRAYAPPVGVEMP